MEKKKDELLNFAFNEQDDKLKFYREILVKMVDRVFAYQPFEASIEDVVKKADKIVNEIIKKCDEYEIKNTQNLILDSDRVKHYVSTTTDENFRTIVDNGPQHGANQKSYGTLGEHWKELMDLFDIKSKHGINSIKDIDENCLIAFQNDWSSTNKLYSVFNKLGIDFIKDFIKACEKCEE